MTAQSTATHTQMFRVAVQGRAAAPGEQYIRAAQQIGIEGLRGCQVVRLYFLRGALAAKEVERLADELLVDPVTEIFSISTRADSHAPDEPPPDDALSALVGEHTIDVTLLPGVTDPVAENLLRAARLLGLDALEQAATGHSYLLSGDLSSDDLHRLAGELFSNPVIQRYAIDRPLAPPFVPTQGVDTTVETIPLRDADEFALIQISTQRRLALNLAEMQAIQEYFRTEERDPTDAELEMLAQTWSEHCVHKTFKATIISRGGEQGPQTINGLLRTYIQKATDRLAKPWVRSAFVDNAGIVAFDDHWDLAFKVETHNRPSALEPFGGANTGVGGVVRDVLGVSARPIANTDVLCFGMPDMLPDALPEGVLHPRRIAEGVVSGIEDYGNKMGIPTVNGAICYHPGYTANPLVFCGCLGILPRDSHPAEPQPGDLIVVVGGRTGRDGLGGATFSSMEIDHDTSKVAGSAVQIGHPIHEKQVLEVVLRARDERLYHAITDCGAGGLSSAVGEMGQHIGATVHLENVPLKYAGLRPWEIWLSEAQERMVLAVPPDSLARLQAICAGQEIEGVVIGTFEPTGRMRLFYDSQQVGDVAMPFLHDGLPRRYLVADQSPSTASDGAARAATPPFDAPLASVLLALLAHPTIRSKEPVVRRYDHEVQGATAIKPLVGTAGHGPGDATVLVPLDTLLAQFPVTDDLQFPAPRKGVALGAGICPHYSEHDPYTMAWAAIDEAMRNVVAVGADPDHVALLDNFCWGNPNLPDRLGSLVRCAQGCYDAALAYGAPFISGKDSLSNEYTGADGNRQAIPGTLLISALGMVPDVQRTATMDLKRAGNRLYLVGDTRDEMGGSHFALVNRGAVPDAAMLPQPVPDALERLRVMHQAIASELVYACHDCSEGGLGVALAEMCLAGRLGAQVRLADVAGDEMPDHVRLFSESLCRFVVEVHPSDAPAFEELLSDQPWALLGEVSSTPELVVQGRDGAECLREDVAALEAAWRDIPPAPPVAAETPTEPPAPATPESIALDAMGQIDQGLRASLRPLIYDRTFEQAPVTTQTPRVLVLHANGTNRDRDAALACWMAGGDPEVVHVSQLLGGDRNLLDYHMLVVPGGFSYGDDLGAGTLWALDLRSRLGESVARFVASGRPVLGICNGFQALVKAGLLPGALQLEVPDAARLALPNTARTVTLAPNHRGHFECRWVHLQPQPNSPCVFTQGMSEPLHCPVAHGEGRVQARDDATLRELTRLGLVALTYTAADGAPAAYPGNPNGSALDIAGLCNMEGNVLGLMPHPENHIFPWQHPRWQRGASGMFGLRLFANGLKSVR